jgi:hypothetical protein
MMYSLILRPVLSSSSSSFKKDLQRRVTWFAKRQLKKCKASIPALPVGIIIKNRSAWPVCKYVTPESKGVIK